MNDVMVGGERLPTDLGWLGSRRQVDEWVTRYAPHMLVEFGNALRKYELAGQVMVPIGLQVNVEGEWRLLAVELLGGGGRAVASSQRAIRLPE
jgi:hypothetical protein